MTSELRPAVELADEVWDLLQNEGDDQNAIGAIEADREAVRAEQAREIGRLREALKELVEEYVRNVDCTRLGGFYLDPETEDCIIDARAALAGDSHDQ